MPRLMLLATALLAAPALAAAAAVQNPKRGLVYVESPDAEVNSIWIRDGSPLTWYYNYMQDASDALASAAQSDFEFVPMMWGAGADANDTSFLANVTALIRAGGSVSHVLGFNQPDAPDWDDGGSNMAPAHAARLWVRNFVPLRERGIKIGLPVVRAGVDAANNWTTPFLANCSELLGKEGGEKGSGKESRDCPFDFVPIHAFGNLSALTRRIKRFSETFSGKPIWVTEYAAGADEDLNSTQTFFNESLKYLDDSDAVERYAYFGAFRSDVSNVGPNGAMLDRYNRLTDIGSWYLDGNATGNLPVYDSDSGQGGNGSDGGSGSACNADHPCGNDKNSGHRSVDIGLQWLGVPLLTLLVTLA